MIRSFIIELLFLVTLSLGRVQMALRQKEVTMSNLNLVAIPTGRVIFDIAAADNRGYDGFVSAKKNSEEALQVVLNQNYRRANIAADKAGKAAARARRVFVGSLAAVKARLASKVRNSKAANELSAKTAKASSKRKSFKKALGKFKATRAALNAAIVGKVQFFENWSYIALMSNRVDFDVEIKKAQAELDAAKADFDEARIEYSSKLTTVCVPAVAKVNNNKGAVKDKDEPMIDRSPTVEFIPVWEDIEDEFNFCQTFSSNHQPHTWDMIATVDSGNGKMDVVQVTYDDIIKNVIAKTCAHSNLGKALSSLKRRMGHLPMATLTMLPGSDGAPKIIVKTNGRDNIGLVPFADAFGLQPLTDEDVILLEANGVDQASIDAVALSYVDKGYRPVGARMMIRCFDDAGKETVGADYIRAIDMLLGTLVDVRSYFSLGSAPALKTFKVEDSGITTSREGGDNKPVLFFAGPAKDIFKKLDGTEGGLPISEGAMHEIFGAKKPGQPRLVLRLNDKKAVLFKGNYAVMSARAFKDDKAPGGYIFLTRAHFDDTDAGKASWREGFDFMYLEEDTPKGRFKSEVKFDSFQKLDVKGKLSGWLIAEASDSQGSSLVSYQVLALLAKAQGLSDLAEKIDSLVSKAVASSVAMVEADLQKLDLDSIFVDDLGLMREWVAGNAPNSARQGRKNHLGFGAKMSTGYIHMASLFLKGNIVVGNEFGLTAGKIKRDQKANKLPLFEDVCGGKNPILDHNQVFLGKAFRLRAISLLRDLLESNDKLSNHQERALDLLFGDQITGNEDRIECLRWILAYAPSLTRGSILMNAEDVADLAGDDDGDQLWFSFRCSNTLAVFKEVKAQALGNQNYSIENNKGAQLPSEVGAKDFADMLTAKGDELREMVLFIMAPNKGQGPVGFLANLCTVLITFFKKVDNGNGGLKFENVWVERLQAALNLMQQTSIDLQKRIYATICLLRWTLADLRKEKTGKGLVPGFNFPALGYDFDPKDFNVNSFSKEDYKKALKKVDMPMIPHHYTGELMSVCTKLDSQYNIGVIGSWLIWECLSLIVTDKPAAWCDDMPKDAKGGLNPYEIVGDIMEKGLAIALFGTDQIVATLMEKYLLAESLYVEKASQLYSWKSQSKNRAFDVKAPPALELNHQIALREKAKYVPAEAPSFNINEIISAIEKEFAVYSLNENKLKLFFDKVLHCFQVEAALANNLKATSQKYQTAEERSGVEALNLLLDALDNFKKANSVVFHKLALGISDTINPRVAIENKDAKIGLVAMMLAWHQRELAAWAFDEMADQVYALQEFEAQEGNKYSKTKAWENEISKWNLKDSAHLAKSAVRGKNSLLRKNKLFLERCESNLLLAIINPKGYEKKKAKATWFIDEGIPALVKAKERQTIVSSKRDVLRNVTDAVRDWHNYRNDWSDDQVTMEILVATFANGDSLWFEPIKEKLQVLAGRKNSLAEIKRIKLELRKAPSNDARKAIKAQLYNARKGGKAQHLLDALEAENYRAPQLVDMFCDPKQNPFAKEFVVGLRQNSGPIVNIERAWRRATDEERKVIQAWTQELGDWISYQKADRETGMKSNHSRLYAYSRVEWELGQKATAFYTRSLLESGLSVYKLTPIPGRRSQTWRYFDAFVYNYQPLNDWQVANGIGHLISVAAPLAAKDSDDSRWARFNSVKFLLEEVKAYDGYDLNLLNAFDKDSVEKDLEGIKEEIERIKNLASNGLMARWGHLWFPVTWGFVKRTYAGQLTQKKLAGRAYIALKLLGLHNPKYHEQPEYIQGPGEVMLPNVTKVLKPLPSNGRHMPWSRSFTPRDSSRTKARILKQLGATDFDDSVDLKPFSWDGGCQKTFPEWLDFIQGVAAEGLGDISGLVMSGLWFQSHTGRLSVMDPNSDIYSKEIADKCRKKLLSTPSYEARLHVEDLGRGEWVKPVYPKMTEHATDAFYAVIRKLTKTK